MWSMVQAVALATEIDGLLRQAGLDPTRLVKPGGMVHSVATTEAGAFALQSWETMHVSRCTQEGAEAVCRAVRRARRAAAGLPQL